MASLRRKLAGIRERLRPPTPSYRPRLGRDDFPAAQDEVLAHFLERFVLTPPLAREKARQVQQQAPEPLVQEPKVVYVRRNFTVAELLVTFLIACAVVLGGQFAWNFFTDVLPRIEIREK